MLQSNQGSGSPFVARGKYVTCPVSQVGRGGGQGQSLISLATYLRGNFGSSGKWAASAPSKGWGRTHIANSSRPGTFKRPGAGVAIRAPATQTLCFACCLHNMGLHRGEGKLPTAIPIFQPLSRCHRDYAGWLMTSVETKRKHWQRSWSKKVSRPARQRAQFAEKLGSANIGLQSV